MQTSSSKFDFRVRWEPYLLRPDMPADGVAKPPPGPGNPRVGDRMKAAGSKVGIDFTGKCDRYPNTLIGHTLLEYAKNFEDGKYQNDIQEALFQAYFTDGVYPDKKNVLDIAEKAGLNRSECDAFVSDSKNVEQVTQKARSWSEKGVTGVPMFYFNGQQGFSGAQEVDAFVKVFDVIAKKFPAQPNDPSASA